MFDLVKKSKILVGIILGLLAIPFAFFGVDFYFRGSDSADAVAEVGGARVTTREFSQALQQQQDRLREQMQGKVAPSLLDSPQLREAVLNQLVDERVAYTSAVKQGVTVGDTELRAIIAETPAFRDNGGTGGGLKKLQDIMWKKEKAPKAQLKTLKAQIDLIRGELDKALLARFDKLMERYGFAVAEVDDGACQGCNINVSTQMSSAIEDTNDIFVCENCGKYLVAAKKKKK